MRRLLLLYALSGAFSLGYQVVWLRHFVDRFGSSTFTFVLVVCCFIAGLSAGAIASERVARRVRRVAGGRGDLGVYGAVELLVAASVTLTWVEALVPQGALGAFPYVDRDGIFEPRLAWHLARVPMAALSVLVPCFFMGVTYPFLCRVFARHARFPSRLYAWNTLGACTAVLACEWLLLRYLGTDRTLVALVAANAALGLGFVLRGERLRERCEREEPGAPEPAPDAPDAPAAVEITYGVLLAGAVVSGFLSGALEADAFRRVHFLQVSNGSAMAFVSFWAIAAIFLGSALVHRVRGWSLGRIQAAYVLGLAIHAGTTHAVLPRAAAWFARFTRSSGASSFDPDGVLTTTFAVLVATGLATFPFFLCISTLLPWLCDRAQREGRHLGVLYGLNTAAFLFGMVVFSWAAPAVDMFYSFKLCAVTFAVAVAWLLLLRAGRPLRAWRPAVGAAGLAAAALLTPRGFDPDYFPEGAPLHTAPVRALKGSPALTTFVAELPDGDGIFLGSSQMSGTSRRARHYMNLMAHFPLLAHPDPESALLICFGAGNTANAIAQHSSIERIDVVDLSRNMLETAPEFEFHNDRVHLDPRVRMIHDDGRNYLNVTDRRYDLITSEPPPPLQQGICRLYSIEYYRAVLDHLTPRGLMTQWLPIYQMPPEAGRLIARTFVQAFPHTLLVTGYADEFVLVGSPAPIDLANVVRRFGVDAAVAGGLADVTMPTPDHLLARVVMPDAELRRRYGTGPVVTDQRNALSAYWVTGEVLAFPYTPDAVLDALGPGLLEERPRLRAALTDLVELRTLVPDYPTASLVEAQVGRVPVAGTDVDWRRVADLNRRAQRRLRRGDFAGGWSLASESLALVDRQYETLLDRGWLLVSAGRGPEAVDWFRRGVSAFPEYQELHFGLAAARAEAGDLDGAVASLEDALALNPRFFEALVRAGDLLARQGRPVRAARHYQRALELKPMAESVRTALRRLGG